jgi:hypothetical protein
MIRTIQREHPEIYDALRKGKPIPLKNKMPKRRIHWGKFRTERATASMKGMSPEAIARGVKPSDYWKDNPALVRRVSGATKTEAQAARAARKVMRKQNKPYTDKFVKGFGRGA